MIYNVVPQNTITAPLFGKLLEIENVVGIKQSVGGIMAFYEMKMVNGKRGKVFSATDEMCIRDRYKPGYFRYNCFVW